MIDIDELSDLMRLNPNVNPIQIKEFLEQEANERANNGI